jgi:hypothetical protein
MNSNPQQNQTQNSGLHPLASFFLASGGAVVGSDYANWLNVDPIFGALIGGVVSLVILQIAYRIHKDPEGKIKKGFTEFGLAVGLILGAVIAGENSDNGFAWLVGGGVGAGVGAWLGQMAAAIVSLTGFAVLFLSQGPVGLAVRTFILNGN